MACGRTRSRPDAALFVGSGKADEIAALVKSSGVELAIFNHDLSPSQERCKLSSPTAPRILLTMPTFGWNTKLQIIPTTVRETMFGK